MAVAVVAWSPVIIFTSIPALWQLRTAAMAAARGGSSMACSPVKLSEPRRASISSSGRLAGGGLSRGQHPQPATGEVIDRGEDRLAIDRLERFRRLRSGCRTDR